MISLDKIFFYLSEIDIEIDDYSTLKGGVNSISYLLNSKKDKYFLKIYKKDIINQFNRINSEINFLEYLSSNKFKKIPEIISFDLKNEWILLEWIEGSRIKKIKKEYVEQLISFIRSIQEPKNKYKVEKMPDACEACFNLNSHKNLISNKIWKTINKVKKITNIDQKLIQSILNELIKKKESC